MKRIIFTQEETTVTPDRLEPGNVVAYRCQNSEHNYATLAKINKGGRPAYGFVPLGDSFADPRYVSDSWRGSLEEAGKNRKLFTFPNTMQLCKAIVEKKF